MYKTYSDYGIASGKIERRIPYRLISIWTKTNDFLRISGIKYLPIVGGSTEQFVLLAERRLTNSIFYFNDLKAIIRQKHLCISVQLNFYCVIYTLFPSSWFSCYLSRSVKRTSQTKFDIPRHSSSLHKGRRSLSYRKTYCWPIFRSSRLSLRLILSW